MRDSRIRFGFLILVSVVIIFGLGCKRIKTNPHNVTLGKWVTFTNVECGFQVDLPSVPKISKDKFTKSDKTVEIFQFISEPDLQTAYGISVTTIPIEKEFSPEEIEILLDSGRDNVFRTSRKPKLLREQKITFGSNPGREIDLETLDGKMFIKVREYLVGKRVYVLTAAAPLQDNQEASRFFGTFTLLDGPTNQ